LFKAAFDGSQFDFEAGHFVFDLDPSGDVCGDLLLCHDDGGCEWYFS
jgi:hypothetical protein